MKKVFLKYLQLLSIVNIFMHNKFISLIKSNFIKAFISIACDTILIVRKRKKAYFYSI